MPQPYLVKAQNFLHNPSASTLRQLAEAMPNAKITEFGNVNVGTRVVARSKASTFIVTDFPQEHSDQTMSRARYDEMAAQQNSYIAETEMLTLEGYIGPARCGGTPVRLYLESANANIAAMQQQLFFPVPEEERENFQPVLNIIYTPNMKAEGFPNDRLIAVDLDNLTTRVFNSDYFGESKKGGLRMWNKLIYDQGGLALHAGAKVIPVAGANKLALIIGLSGTGKTTTTFSNQNDSQPLQDDFVGWLKKGSVVGSENGCFAKTFGLNAAQEPMIHGAVIQKEAFLENVSQVDEGTVNFADDSYTQNGRATFPLSMIPEAGDVTKMDKVDFILLLNRNETIIPAVAKLGRAQAAAFFMLGETQGTSAGGKEESGKSLRVPGTNPFFPLRHGLQGHRFLEMLERTGAEVYLMNTGWIGGAEGTEFSRKVKIKHSSAVVKAIAEETITWQKDDDFGYQIATLIPGMEDSPEMLSPKYYYAKNGKTDIYQQLVAQLKSERETHLADYPTLDSAVSKALAG